MFSWLIFVLCVSDLTIDDEDEEEIIERRRRERQALMSKLNAENSTHLAPTKVFEVVSASTDPVDDDRDSEDEEERQRDDDDDDAASSVNGYDMSDNSPGNSSNKA